MLIGGLLALTLCSCQEDLSQSTTNGLSQEEVKAIIAKYNFFETMEVPAQTGKLTVVTDDETGDTLMISRADALLEKSKFSNVSVNYIDDIATRAANDDDVYLQPEVMTVNNKVYQVMFEDVVDGDNDYNDVVLYIRSNNHENFKKQHRVSLTINPIAMGGSIDPISFGVVLPDGQEFKIDDVRQTIFKGEQGFINTGREISEIKINNSSNTRYDWLKHQVFEVGSEDENIGVKFFIEVNGKRKYAAYGGVDAAYNNDEDIAYLKKDQTPYGIVLSKLTRIPYENVSIYEAFPMFRDWIDGKASKGSKPFDSKNCKKELTISLEGSDK